MDRISPRHRSRVMSSVGGKHTKPEIRVRKILHALGVRFRLHARNLPGSPDIVLPRRRIAIFVHGCFWHRHKGCAKASTPDDNREFWLGKFAANRKRDSRTSKALAKLGWKVIILWECETADPIVARALLQKLLKLPPR